MLQKLKLTIIIFSLFTITSCSYLYGDRGIIKYRENDYLKAQNIQPLRIPPGYNSDSIQEHYPVSYKQFLSTPRVDLTPPGLN